MAFPTLSTAPLVSPFEETAALDPVIRSQMEVGYEQTRPRFTRVPDKWHIEYGDLSDTDYALLKAWEIATMYGAASDTWTHPKTIASHTVRLAAPIRYKLNETDTLWTASFDLKKV